MKAEASAPPSGGKSAMLMDINERVLSKEGVRDDGVSRLNKIWSIIDNCSGGSAQDDAKFWKNSLDTLKGDLQSREILVGILGETGLGKSSLLNALLGVQLVPTNQSEACTAAVCIYGWSTETDEQKRFSAKITFKSWECVAEELNVLKAEIKNRFEDMDDESFGEEEDNAFFQQLVGPTKQWSNLDLDEIRQKSADEIIENSDTVFRDIFRNGEKRLSSNTRICYSSSANKFQQMLKPYVDSSKPTKKSPSRYWPLVHEVEIFVKSEILRNGIKLVDLPGSHDAMEVRGQMAQRFAARLDKRVVVTPAARAADNKAAAELILTKEETLDLVIDGMLNCDALCVAITKIDDIETSNAEEEFPAEDVSKVCKALRQLQEGNDDDEEDLGSPSSLPLKRPHNESDRTRPFKRQKMEETELCDIKEMNEDSLLSHLKYLCIKARNVDLIQKVSQCLLKTTARKGKFNQSTNRPLSTVFPVSSKAFQALMRENRTRDSEGFPTLESTGIPGLREWLRQVSLPYREEWADSDMNRIQVLLDAADGWVQDANATLPVLKKSEIPRVKHFISKITIKLQKASILSQPHAINNKVRIRIQQNLTGMKPLRDSNLKTGNIGLKSKKGRAETAMAFNSIKKAVKNFKFKNCRAGSSSSTASRYNYLHWATYKANVRRQGNQFTRRARKGQPRSSTFWMGDIGHGFWLGHESKWKHEFAHRLPLLRRKIRPTALLAFEACSKELHDSQKVPMVYRDLVRANAYKLHNLFEEYIGKVRDRFQQLMDEFRECKMSVLKKLTSRMHLCFENAINEHGKGIMEKQARVLEGYVASEGEKMINSVRNEVEDAMAKKIGQFSSDVGNFWGLRKADTGYGALIKNELLRLSLRLQGKQSKQTRGRAISEECKLRLSAIINDWRKTWKDISARLPLEVTVEPMESQDEDDGEQKVKMEEEPETCRLHEMVGMVKTEPEA
ncbi:Nuclear GTPase SLIP-GC [Colletotrichum trifolii]|uniref:Nuclear GTPase SLIP-GC n=1 Tax=Colletotrichum trifolii TaxID=5466 RepID=A0A4R8PYT0_COLTR|nr:Nuclear GTPase SLIP-GC [Colletotrichum trifolii]